MDRQVFDPSSLDASTFDLSLVCKIWSQSGSLFHWGFSIPVYPFSIGFSIGASWRASLDLEVNLCFSKLAAESALMPSAAIDINGKGYAGFLVVRGGIGVTATVLNTRIVPEVSVALIPSPSRPPGIAFDIQLQVVPLAVRIYVYLEALICIKWCKLWIIPVPCGLKWCKVADITLAKWALGSMVIQGPRHHFGIYPSTPPVPGSVVATQISPSMLAVEWHGFRDIDTKILSYSVCIGSQPNLSDLLPCIDVGLATSFQRSGLELSHGRELFVTIRCASLFATSLCCLIYLSLKFMCPVMS
jgi:hypothetical protein